MTLYKWSQTASADASADSTINWAEGQAPSSINDSARAMMAATAKYRDDISGAIVTGGTSVAYTVSSYQVFDSLSDLNGQIIAFTPHTTNGATVTLSVDSLGAKPLRSAPSTELLAGVLIQGTPYIAVYNHSDQAFYLHGFYGNPYNVPLAAGMDYWAPTTPNSAFAFPTGQAISRSTYSALFALIGTTYGGGDGSTTFNLPDKTGRVSAMKEAAETRLTASYFGGNSANLGAVGGVEKVPLTAALVPDITSSGTNNISVASTISSIPSGVTRGDLLLNGGGGFYGAGALTQLSVGAITSTGSNSINVSSAGTGGASPNHNNVQPTIICNYIMRVL